MRKLPLAPPTSPRALLLVAGTRLKQCGCMHTGLLGGWLRDRTTGSPVLVTSAHILAPRPEIYDRPRGAPPLPVLSHGDGGGAWLCTAGDPVPVARVLRAGVAHGMLYVRSLDVAVAVPVGAAQVPDRAVPVRLSEPRVGQRVSIVGAPPGSGLGAVVGVGWDSGHYGADADVLVAPVGEGPFSRAGMSGAWVVDEATGDPMGMLAGEVSKAPRPEMPRGPLAVLHPLSRVLALFDLALDGACG